MCIRDRHQRASYISNIKVEGGIPKGLFSVKVIKGKYNLEVSSPGLDRPLFTDEQLKEHVGYIARIVLNEKYKGKRKITGLIKVVNDSSIIIKCNENDEEIPLDLIYKANLVTQF